MSISGSTGRLPGIAVVRRDAGGSAREGPVPTRPPAAGSLTWSCGRPSRSPRLRRRRSSRERSPRSRPWSGPTSTSRRTRPSRRSSGRRRATPCSGWLPRSGLRNGKVVNGAKTVQPWTRGRRFPAYPDAREVAGAPDSSRKERSASWHAATESTQSEPTLAAEPPSHCRWHGRLRPCSSTSTRERRSISSLICPTGLVDQIVRRCARGNAAKAGTSAFAVSVSGPVLGRRAASSSRALSQAAGA